MSRLVALLYGRPLGLGGVETHLLALLARSDPARYRYRVVGEVLPPFKERAEAAGAEIVAWSPRSAWDLPALLELPGLLRGAALLHLHSPRALAFGRLVGPVVRRPVVLTVHGPGGAGPARRRAYARAEGLLGRGIPVIYVSSRALEEARQAGSPLARRAVSIPNGVTLSVPPGARGIREGMGVPDRETLGITVARLEPEKGVATLLDAIRLVPELRFWIVGEGSERRALEARARDLGVHDRVRFLGARTDVPALLGAADLFVLPSRMEGMSLGLLEAMAAGLPAIATDVGENPGLLLEGDAGLVVRPSDPEAIASALRKLLADAALRARLGRSARAAAGRWSEESMVERTMAVYDGVLG